MNVRNSSTARVCGVNFLVETSTRTKFTRSTKMPARPSFHNVDLQDAPADDFLGASDVF
jgi:hypothetical protein